MTCNVVVNDNSSTRVAQSQRRTIILYNVHMTFKRRECLRIIKQQLLFGWLVAGQWSLSNLLLFMVLQSPSAVSVVWATQFHFTKSEKLLQCRYKSLVVE
uniref:Uncharacterized protein n=1 Tax=Schizaphis graminum TaxID=13262 RepID=A0A2S2P025_SCHGA